MDAGLEPFDGAEMNGILGRTPSERTGQRGQRRQQSNKSSPEQTPRRPVNFHLPPSTLNFQPSYTNSKHARKVTTSPSTSARLNALHHTTHNSRTPQPNTDINITLKHHNDHPASTYMYPVARSFTSVRVSNRIILFPVISPWLTAPPS